jgi:hypothetical protein
MRTLTTRWLAVIALVAGVTVGATASPASAAPRTSASTSTQSTAAHPARTVQPQDWWL